MVAIRFENPQGFTGLSERQTFSIRDAFPERTRGQLVDSGRVHLAKLQLCRNLGAKCNQRVTENALSHANSGEICCNDRLGNLCATASRYSVFDRFSEMNMPRILLVFTAVTVLLSTGCAKQKPAISEDAPPRDQALDAPGEQKQQDTLNTEPARDENFESLFEPNQPGTGN